MPQTPDSACPLPTPQNASESEVIRLLLSAQRIAVIGISDDPTRPSHYVSEYMRSIGKEIIPVNPNLDEIFGQKCYASLKDIPGPIDLVNVFRRPLACADVTRDAIAIGAKGIWLQSGITNDEARQLAQKAGIPFVQNRCIMVESRRR